MQVNNTNSENTPKTWIHAYQGISGQEFNMEIVMKTIGQISIEEETRMNNTINDRMMVPIIPFERQIFEMVDAESGDLISIDMIPSFLNFVKEEHSLAERMMLLEVIQSFSKSRYIRKLYKEGLLDILRPWVSYELTPEAEALTEATLTFLLNAKVTKKIILNYSFNIGKAIVKVKKNSNETNKELAEKVQKHWTDILSSEEKPEPANQDELIILPPYSPESLITLDSVAHHTRSRGQVTQEFFDSRKRLRPDPVYTEEDKQKILWDVRIRRLDRRNKYNIHRHQSNNRCNIKLTIRLDYSADCAYIQTPRSDVLTATMEGFTPSTNPDVIDYVSFYAGSYIRQLHLFPNPYIVPDELSITPAVRGMRLYHHDIKKILDYLDTGYCGHVVKSYYVC